MARGLPVALGIVLAIGTAWSQPAEPGYAPVAPPAALHAALQSNLKQFRDWVDEQDYASAAGTARGVIALAQLYAYQSGDPAWRKQVAELVAACSRLPEAAGRKSAADCRKELETCQRLLAALAKGPPAGPRPVDGSFKPPATIKTWMMLLDAAYSDAKYAKTPQQRELLAYLLAEEANASAYLRSDAGWRQQAWAVRDAALQVARQPGDDPAAGRKALKEVYQRCEACHQRQK